MGERKRYKREKTRVQGKGKRGKDKWKKDKGNKEKSK